MRKRKRREQWVEGDRKGWGIVGGLVEGGRKRERQG